MKASCGCSRSTNGVTSAAEFQDRRNGPGVRYVNPVNKSKKDGKVMDWKCTVCGRVHQKVFGG